VGNRTEGHGQERVCRDVRVLMKSNTIIRSLPCRYWYIMGAAQVYQGLTGTVLKITIVLLVLGPPVHQLPFFTQRLPTLLLGTTKSPFS
jgi:hypothetical protein